MLEEYNNMATECELRGEGCKLDKSSCDFTERDYEGWENPGILWSCCCSCKPKKDDFTSSTHDFGHSDYKGDDLLEDLLEFTIPCCFMKNQKAIIFLKVFLNRYDATLLKLN